MAPLQAQHVGGAGDVAFGLVQLLHDVIAFSGFADLVKTPEGLGMPVG